MIVSFVSHKNGCKLQMISVLLECPVCNLPARVYANANANSSKIFNKVIRPLIIK